MTPGDIRIRKIGQRDLLTVAPQVNPPQPPATEPSIETHRPEHMQPVSSQAEQIARSTRSPTLVLRGPTQETSPTTLRSSEPPTLTLRGRTQQMTPTAQRAEDRERSIPNSDRDDQPDESRSMQYEKVFPPYGGLLNPAPASASPRKPRPTYTMAQALEYVKTQDSRRAAAEADAAAESSGVQSEQGISDDLQGPVGRSDRTMQLREPGGSVDEISGEVENLTRDIDGNDGGVCEDEKQRSSEGGSLANASSKEDKRNDG